MPRWPGAIWQPVAQKSGVLRPIAVCLHHQAGSGNPASVYASRGVSAHLWLPRAATPVQHVDTSERAWHGMAHNDYSIGVETEGCGAPPHADPLTDHQLICFASFMRWANEVHRIPLTLSESVTQPGLNYHRCQGGPATACPCDVRVAARAEILRRATGSAAAPPSQPSPTESEDNMVLNDALTRGTWVAFRDGAVHAIDGAPFLGAANNDRYNAGKKPCIGIADNNGDGYKLILDFGGRDLRTFHFPRDGSAVVR